MTTLLVSELQRGDRITTAKGEAIVQKSYRQGAIQVIFVQHGNDRNDRLEFSATASVTFHPGAFSEW